MSREQASPLRRFVVRGVVRGAHVHHIIISKSPKQ